ncbi:glycosyltransferase [Jeotgalibacillus aurantiacus]|uniref:glycosyltransferase n=1 Tax=Jeotgalibacillus aurantiacus TaxID=2763266 RepID=UPI001D0B2F11|nr:glycosyltransferase [Jeotgalibacillus aurantiacus]
MKKLLIATYDLEIGGVERSLISLLEKLDYTKFEVDLMLYSHKGEFLSMLPDTIRLLDENPLYKTFRMSVRETAEKGHVALAVARGFARLRALLKPGEEKGVRQMQYMWRYASPFLPDLQGEYDLAISYLWPHHFVAKKVKARHKIAWIHTDFSSIPTDEKEDLRIWSTYQTIAAISESCAEAFIAKYPSLTKSVMLIENITSPEMVKSLAATGSADIMVSDPSFKLITVARLSHAKGIDRAVEVLHQIHQNGYKNISWYVVGYGGDEGLVRSLIEKYKLQQSFHLLGKQLNPYPFIQAGDLYVQPSRYEGKAVTVGEAQILGKPVLITNYPTAESQVSNHIDGWICPQSIEGMTEAVLHLYHNPDIRKSLIRNCLQTDYGNSHELNKLYQLV